MGEIADIPELAVDETTNVEVADNFADPLGQDWWVEAESSDEDVATVEADGTTVTVTAEGPGTATITVYAVDDDGLMSDHLSFEVTVEPADEPMNESPEQVDTIDGFTMMVGDAPRSVDVSGKFSDPDGDDLTISATSSNPAAATASESGNPVMVTAVAVGMTTITVTATDEGGLTATQMFEVSVKVAIPKTVMIAGKDKTETIEIGEDERIVSQNERIVTASPQPGSDTTWILKGEGEGATTLSIIGADATRTRNVKVLNSAPERKVDSLSAIQVPKWYDFEAKAIVTDVVDVKPTKEYSPDLARNYHVVKLPDRDTAKGPYFDDADGLGDFKYVGRTDSPHVVVKEVMKPTNATGGPTAVIDVMRMDEASFELIIYIEDEEAKSDPLHVTVQTVMPLPDSGYTIEQLNNGNFRGSSLVMYNRQKVKSEVTFTAQASLAEATPPTSEGFTFAKLAIGAVKSSAVVRADHAGSIVGARDASDNLVSGSLAEPPKKGSNATDDASTEDSGDGNAAVVVAQYSVKTTGGIVAVLTNVAEDEDPTVDLTLRGTGGDVTITYHYAVDADLATSATHRPKWHEVSRTFKVTVR